MTLKPTDIAQVSQLLDQALELPASERQAWLAALPAEHQRHAAALQSMLAAHESATTADHLDSLPRLGPTPGEGTGALAGQRVGAYSLIREIGRGGMGSVWLAERADGSFKRQVALKLPRLAWGAGLAERMAREREIGALLEHPNIARLYDAGVDEHGRPFLALEYIDGQPIDAWCEAQGLSVRDRLRLFVQVAHAVAYAHGRLVVHRDLKPSNVLVTANGQAHLLDFGIAKLLHEAGDGAPGLTQSHERLMTPHYAAPEQVAGEAITVQTDVYALGVLLYELLTRTRPIEARRASLGAVEDAILQGDAPPASGRVKDKAVARALRGEVDAILGKAMQLDPARRYATAESMALDIERYLRGETVMARPDSLTYRLNKTVQRHWVGFTALGTVVIAVASGTGVALFQAERAAKATEHQRLVTEFVADMFRPADRSDGEPSRTSDPSPLALLDRGAKLITTRFGGQPELQAELYGVVGGVFSDMGAYRLAGEYSMLRVELLSAGRLGEAEQAHALLVAARAMLDEARIGAGEQTIRRAMRLAQDDELLQLQAEILLARAQIASGQLSSADALLEIANKRLFKMSPSSVSKAWITAMRARLLMIRNRLDESIPEMERAIVLARSSEGPASMAAVAMGLDFANQLGQTNHYDIARRHFDQSVAVLRSKGGPHQVRAALASARFAWRSYAGGGNGTLADAISALEKSRDELQNTVVPKPDWFVSLVEFWLGSVRAESGNVEAGLQVFNAVIGTLSGMSDIPLERFYLAGPAGNILMYSGQHELANKWFQIEMQSLREAGGLDHPYSATVYHHLAWNLMMGGQLKEAEAVLDAAPLFKPIRGYGSDVDRYNRFLVETRAQIRLAQGDAAGALALVKGEPPRLELASGDDGFDRTLTVLGEARCAAGQPMLGLPILQEWLAKFEANQHFAHAPWTARLRAVMGHCALAAGDRNTAQRLQTAARAAFTAQPGVSPYYKAPLIKLERALSLRLPPF